MQAFKDPAVDVLRRQIRVADQAHGVVGILELLLRAAESALVLGARTEAAAYLETAATLERAGPTRDELLGRAAEIRDAAVPGSFCRMASQPSTQSALARAIDGLGERRNAWSSQ